MTSFSLSKGRIIVFYPVQGLNPLKICSQQEVQDFFYICTSHLTDKGFASPIVDAEAEAAKRRKEAMDREIEKVKKEYEEKLKAKKAKKKSKGDDKEKKQEDDNDDSKAEKERDEKVSKPITLENCCTTLCNQKRN